jgi:hypothetical protein
MRTVNLSTSRLIAGIILVVIAALLFVFGQGNVAVAGVVALAVLGLISIATARRSAF